MILMPSPGGALGVVVVVASKLWYNKNFDYVSKEKKMASDSRPAHHGA